MEEKKELWFKRKRYGWGWTPSNAKGWLTVLFFLTTITYSSYYFCRDKNNIDAVSLLVSVFLQVIILIFICYKKGEAPKWQWGDQNKKD